MVNNERKTGIGEIFNIILLIFLILFSLVIIYQLVLKILGGSWTTEFMLMSLGIGIVTALLMIVGFLISLSRGVGRLEGNFGSFRESFVRFTGDFKELESGFGELKDDFKEHVRKKKH